MVVISKERMLRAISRATLSLPEPWLVAMSPRKRALEVDGNVLDPQVAMLLVMNDVAGPPPLHKLGVPSARASFLEGMSVVDVPSRRDVIVEELAMNLQTGVAHGRFYRPEGLPAPSPIVVYFHGGGFVLGDLDSHDALCRTIASVARARVLAVDYRLAPEHVFPAAVDDAIAAVRWARDNADRLGADSGRLAVAGDSAGGNLSAVVARRLRGEIRLACLIYPATDLTRSFPSHRKFADGYLLTRESMDWFLRHYIPSGDLANPDASPLYAPDFTDQAETLVYTAGFDPLRDEGDAYAEKISRAGVTVHHRCFGAQIHGFTQIGGVVRRAAEAVEEIARDMGARLSR